MGGAYSEGGAYWKEGAKLNHYGNLFVTHLLLRKRSLETCARSESTRGNTDF